MVKRQSAKRAKEDLWRERMGRFEEADLAVADFCGFEGVSLASFYAWKRRLGSPASEKATAKKSRVTANVEKVSRGPGESNEPFVDMPPALGAFRQFTVTGVEAKDKPGPLLTASWPNGCRLEVESLDAEVIAVIIRELAQSASGTRERQAGNSEAAPC